MGFFPSVIWPGNAFRGLISCYFTIHLQNVQLGQYLGLQ